MANLSPHDAAIWHTCHINELIDSGSLGSWPVLGTHFPPRLGTGEHMLVSGGFVLHDHTAIGDGSYVHDGSFFYASGRGGLALTAGLAGVTALGNASRRAAARADATPQWRVIDHGQLWVSTHGFYLMTANGLFPWGYDSIEGAQLVAPASVWFTGQSDSGQIAWILASDWAELIFTLWARVRHIQHPQFEGGRWVPPGWRERVIDAEAALPRALTSDSHLRDILGT